MIPKEKELKLIKIYMYICDVYQSSLKFYCQRFSNNATPIFTDQELLTVYLFCGAYQRYFSIKEIHTFTKDCGSMISLIDSMPIITCAGKNKTGKVATEIATKGYCSTKNMYYFGLKLHTLAFRREGTIPFPEMIILSSAEENDLTVLKREAADSLINRYIFADKIYSDFSFWGNKQQEQGVTMMTPVKAIKGEEPIITQREKAGRDLFSTAVSKVRQPIESFFNWLNEKTNIQRAMKVRSTSGLLVHTMGKIAIAFIYLIF